MNFGNYKKKVKVWKGISIHSHHYRGIKDPISKGTFVIVLNDSDEKSKNKKETYF